MTCLQGGETVVVDILLKDDDTLTFGDIVLRVTHTPGHTKGSCCFVCESAKVMFIGDTLFRGSIGHYDLYGGDYNILMKSLQRLKSIKAKYKIYPGHGESTTLADEMVENRYFK